MTDLAKYLKALGDENRLKIVSELKKGETCACELLETLDVSQPTLSHHMKILVASGLVNPRKAGKWVHYSINPSASKHFMATINNIF